MVLNMTYSCLFFVILLSGANAIQNVVQLSQAAFDRDLNHPENPLWLVNFYVPWCKHSIRSNTILEEVAPTLDGRLALGKIDCTVEESLCNQFDIQAYPTLKWYRAGKFQNYEGGLDHDAIFNFANVMNGPVMATYSHYHELSIHNGEVSFLVFASSSRALPEDEVNLMSTEQIHIFSSVAQRFQPSASFGVLTPGEENEKWFKTMVAGVEQEQDNFILVRLEKHIPPLLFQEEWTSQGVETFIDENLDATVPVLDEGNLGRFAQHGKYLVMTVFDNDADKTKSQKTVSDFTRFAFSTSHSIRKDYQFCTMNADGNGAFLDKFSIATDEILVLDYPNNIYWIKPKEENPLNGIESFLKDVIRGNVLSKNLNIDEGPRKDQAFPIGLNHDHIAWFQKHPWALNVYGLFIILGFLILFPTPFLEKYVLYYLPDPFQEEQSTTMKEKKE